MNKPIGNPAVLSCSIGQYSHKGVKQTNQDSHGAAVPEEPHLSTKGIVLAIADGISTSEVSHIASQSSVQINILSLSLNPIQIWPNISPQQRPHLSIL